MFKLLVASDEAGGGDGLEGGGVFIVGDAVGGDAAVGAAVVGGGGGSVGAGAGGDGSVLEQMQVDIPLAPHSWAEPASGEK